MPRLRPLSICLLFILFATSSVFAQTGNTPEDKGPIQVFILSGQSNMDGRGVPEKLTPDQLKLVTPSPDILYYFHLMPGLDYAEIGNHKWEQLAIFTNRWKAKQFGPEITFAKSIAKNMPNQKIAILKLSQGGANLYRDFSPTINDEEIHGYHLYPWLTRTAHRAIGRLEQMGYQPKINAFIWVHGWSDAFASEASANNYEKNLTEFFQYVRRDFDNPKLPIVFSQINPDIKVKWAPPVLSAQTAVAAADQNSIMIPSTDLTLLEDGAHFTPDSYITLGNNLANAYIKLKSQLDEAEKEAKTTEAISE
ncbi:hypothetical protein KS4_35000 [Poriferisphaera corsica]|uniref:Sialate O-acetylesterase domain-containing protein n=1 Tax=Poriferisphaera corsica TaxID=2528020 RepID=A0A517YYZ9_9BACT|nr:sialate O-acetylesterase [Poriferisphaera corsica]QDU35419.1 hypothetical protein KS4_35000 [Poriferisphaera corsica]